MTNIEAILSKPALILAVLFAFGAQSAAAENAAQPEPSPPAFTGDSGRIGVSGISVRLSDKARELRVEIPSDVLFDFDRWGLRGDAAPALQRVAELIAARPNTSLVLEGHTDAKGSEEYNQDLSVKRALAVKAWLVHRAGIDPRRFTVSGWGEKRPLASNTLPDGSDDPLGRRKNRRVELRIRKLERVE